jgi:hypothetical protein
MAVKFNPEKKRDVSEGKSIQTTEHTRKSARPDSNALAI